MGNVLIDKKSKMCISTLSFCMISVKWYININSTCRINDRFTCMANILSLYKYMLCITKKIINVQNYGFQGSLLTGAANRLCLWSYIP